MAEETRIGGENYRFKKTFWTNILRAKDKSLPGCQSALNYLISTYWKPVYFYLRRKGYNIDLAKDLTQSFFTVFLEKDFMKSVDRSKGRFRTFILAALNHFLSKEHERLKAQKRGGSKVILSLDFARAETELPHEPVDRATPEKILIRTWAQAILQKALDNLRRNVRHKVYLDIFEFYLNAEKSDEPATYQKIAAQFDVSETDVRNYLHRLRRQYREYIKGEVRKYCASENEMKEELQELFMVLGENY